MQQNAELCRAEPLLRSIQCRLDGIATLLGIAEQHLGVWLVEHRIHDVSVPGTHTTLHHDNLLALVGVDDGHTGDWAVTCQ